MDQFSISSMARFSGIQPHTIRMWEKRYKALRPNRSEGNTRYYDASQLRRLLNIVSLQGRHKLPELCAMPDDRLFRLVEKDLPGREGTDDDHFIAQLVAAGMSYDESWFTSVFAHCLLRYGLPDAYLKIVVPMLTRLGLMWSGDTITPSHEHFISNLLRQKLFTAIDAFPPATATGDSWILFQPEDEFHEIGLLIAHYLIRRSGRRSYYLGPNVPVASLTAAVRDISPHHLLLFLVRQDFPQNIQHYIDQLVNTFPGKNIYVAGNTKLAEGIKTGGRLQWLASLSELLQRIPNKFV